MPLLREGVRLHFKLYLMPLPSPRSGFVQQPFLNIKAEGKRTPQWPKPIIRVGIFISDNPLRMHSGVRATATGHVKYRDRISINLIDRSPPYSIFHFPDDGSPLYER
uniref:Uncharacterized protein n=2 Tax=Candidatus Kentrum sp. MB TaxID=2138164 RepID=A0A451BH17_9GAMM|nr:MAG: hypothetical protein BECKMB1821H_GA0114242_11711 [Candidatus Kentron sp. MB]